ncbi:hypothetical protein [Sphingobacterium multivorum]|uniref:hypothetical protein n=1 Tax=Sphingobacterium TaxID=28453 RepID=UPI000E9E9A09|nr:hypothetical protein [Sphingobacterium multivorum]HAK31046.1 hypothetical protein [Sphingobacterium sp.]HBI90746.1 hypothetical protein [Sphingobacterium sp.]
MNLKDIFKSLKKWDNLIHDNAKDFKKLKDLLLDVDYFKFRIPYTKASKFIHAYPGIYKGKLTIFIIADIYDTRKYKGELSKYLQMAEVVKYSKPQLSDEISRDEALTRISTWKKDCQCWIPKQAGCKTGFLKCYLIPTKDIMPDDEMGTIAYFALKNSENETTFEADLILKKDDGTAVESSSAYYDTVKLVPPFSPTEEMYLLSEAANYVVD